MKTIKYLNLFKIHLPVSGVVSFLHRISGVILFLAIPLSIYILMLSLRNEAGFTQAIQFLNHPFSYLILIILVLSLFHHLFAGIRFLLLDLEWGMERQQSLKTARVVLILTIITSVLFLLGIWL